jgi:hypothetical protein
MGVPWCSGQGRLDGRGVRAVDGAGLVGGLLHGLDQPAEVFGLLAHEDAGVDVDVIGPGFGLVCGHFLDGFGILGLDGRLDGLAAGVDQFSDDDHEFLLRVRGSDRSVLSHPTSVV